MHPCVCFAGIDYVYVHACVLMCGGCVKAAERETGVGVSVCVCVCACLCL